MRRLVLVVALLVGAGCARPVSVSVAPLATAGPVAAVRPSQPASPPPPSVAPPAVAEPPAAAPEVRPAETVPPPPAPALPEAETPKEPGEPAPAPPRKVPSSGGRLTDTGDAATPVPAKPAPPASTEPPPETVAPPTLSRDVGDEEERRLRGAAETRLERTERILSGIDEQLLDRQQREMLSAIVSFLSKARDALQARDFSRAATLTEKAEVLALELSPKKAR